MIYSKPSLSIEEQINLLCSRGLNIPDRYKAHRYLSHISYSRLKVYWLPFEVAEINPGHRFREGTKFDDVVELYVFDRKLRLLVLEAVERFEVSFRSALVNHLASKNGSHAYLNQNLFSKPSTHLTCLEELRENVDKSKEPLIEHYRHTYRAPDMPPIWAAFEILHFGELAKWYQIIRRPDRKAVSDTYLLAENILNSFVHHLNHVRNISAHHARLWNRDLTITMKIPDHPNEISECLNRSADARSKVYNTLAMLAYLLRVISPSTTWPGKIKKMINGFKQVNPTDMGFPDGWETLSVWAVRTPE